MLKKDREAAGIPYKDALGRQADFHALRHTFGTWLSLTESNPMIIKDAMRHSDLRQTMKYTDHTHLPTAAAIDCLPSLLKRVEAHSNGPLGLGTTCHSVASNGTTCHEAKHDDASKPADPQ